MQSSLSLRNQCNFFETPFEILGGPELAKSLDAKTVNYLDFFFTGPCFSSLMFFLVTCYDNHGDQLIIILGDEVNENKGTLEIDKRTIEIR